MLEASNSVCEAFNVVVYPSYNLGLQPVLGVDLLSFRLGSEFHRCSFLYQPVNALVPLSSNKQLLFGVDWAPMLTDEAYSEVVQGPGWDCVRFGCFQK